MSKKTIENEKKVRRAIEIQFMDGTSKILELDKATAIKANMGILHLDRLSNSRWRLVWSEDIVDEFSKIKAFNIIREDCEQQPSVPKVL